MLSSDVDIGAFRFQELKRTVGKATRGTVNVHTRFCLLEFFSTPQVLEQFIHLSTLYFDGLSGGSGG
jgi:hypothetical protein